MRYLELVTKCRVIHIYIGENDSLRMSNCVMWTLFQTHVHSNFSEWYVKYRVKKLKRFFLTMGKSLYLSDFISHCERLNKIDL